MQSLLAVLLYVAQLKICILVGAHQRCVMHSKMYRHKSLV